MADRPAVHCLVARVHKYGFVTDAQHVTLMEAAALAAAGYTVIVDYTEMEALGTWERENAPLNRPRWHQE